jgi:N-acyl-D-amino-acid deacylase
VKVALLLAVLVPLSAAAQQGDIRIVGGTVYDGSGGSPRVTDVVLRGDQVVFVGDASRWTVRQTIAARGMIVAPGFIDPHTHAAADLGSSDRTRRQAAFALMQGVTTVITGNDGQGPVDVAAERARVQRDSIGPNVAWLVGHGRVRGEVVGAADRAATPAETARMRSLVDSAMRGGALGLSSGLYYAPGSFATTSELVELARIVAQHGGLYDSHIRDESSYSTGLLASVREAIEIGRRAGVPVNISHIKALGVEVHGQAPHVIAIIRAALAEGLEVTADQYPWTASSTGLSSALLPRWAEADGRDSLLARIGDSTVAIGIRAEMRSNLRRRGGAASLLLTTMSSRDSGLLSARGRTLELQAAARGVEPVVAALEILQSGSASVASFNMIEPDIEQFMMEPFVMTGSDGSAGHPRKYATYPRKLRRYVLDKPVVTMERMIQSSTAQVAETFGLDRRGQLCVGCFADVIVFDPTTVREMATYVEPTLLAEGMHWVFVNGVAVVADGRLTEALPGSPLKRR